MKLREAVASWDVTEMVSQPCRESLLEDGKAGEGMGGWEGSRCWGGRCCVLHVL